MYCDFNFNDINFKKCLDMKYPSRQSGLFFHGFRVSYKIRFKSFEVKKFFVLVSKA